jgi:hypothetical protein
MKTSIERIKETIEMLNADISINASIKETLLNYCDVLLKSERDDIRRAFSQGYTNGAMNQDKINNGQTDLLTMDGGDYYNETFKSE